MGVGVCECVVCGVWCVWCVCEFGVCGGVGCVFLVTVVLLLTLIRLYMSSTNLVNGEFWKFLILVSYVYPWHLKEKKFLHIRDVDVYYLAMFVIRPSRV